MAVSVVTKRVIQGRKYLYQVKTVNTRMNIKKCSVPRLFE